MIRALLAAIAPNPTVIGRTTKKSDYDLLYDAIEALEDVGPTAVSADFTAAEAITAGRAVSLNREAEAVQRTSFVEYPTGGVGVAQVANRVFAQSGTTFASVYIGFSPSLNVRLGTVATDGTLSYAAEVLIDTVDAGEVNWDADRLDDTHMAFLYEDGAVLKSVILTVSGGSYTVGTSVTVNANADTSERHGGIVALSATNFITGYVDVGAANVVTFRAATVSGSTITLGTAQALADTGIFVHGALVDASSGKVCWIWRDPTTHEMQASVNTTSGNTITLGTTITWLNNTGGNPERLPFWIVALGDDTAVCCVYSPQNNTETRADILFWVIRINGTVPEVGSPCWYGAEDRDYVFALSTGNMYAVAYNSRTIIVISRNREVAGKQLFVLRLRSDNDLEFQQGAWTYDDLPNTGHPDMNLTDLKGTGADFANRFVVSQAGNPIRNWAFDYHDDMLGIAQDTVSGGGTVTVNMKGVVTENLSGLTPGEFYFGKAANGELSTSPLNGKPVGRALTASSLLLTRGKPHP